MVGLLIGLIIGIGAAVVGRLFYIERYPSIKARIRPKKMRRGDLTFMSTAIVEKVAQSLEPILDRVEDTKRELGMRYSDYSPEELGDSIHRIHRKSKLIKEALIYVLSKRVPDWEPEVAVKALVHNQNYPGGVPSEVNRLLLDRDDVKEEVLKRLADGEQNLNESLVNQLLLEDNWIQHYQHTGVLIEAYDHMPPDVKSEVKDILSSCITEPDAILNLLEGVHWTQYDFELETIIESIMALPEEDAARLQSEIISSSDISKEVKLRINLIGWEEIISQSMKA